jgi:hypothetical protein
MSLSFSEVKNQIQNFINQLRDVEGYTFDFFDPLESVLDETLPILERCRLFKEAIELAQKTSLHYSIVDLMRIQNGKFMEQAGKLVLEKGQFF